MLLLLAGPVVAGEGGADLFSLRSSLKGTLLVSRASEVSVFTPELTSGAALWRLRLEPTLEPSGWLTLSGAWEQRFRLQSSQASPFAPGLPGGSGERGPWRLATLEGVEATGTGLVLSHELDRLSLSLHLPRTEVTLGRQAVGYGRGLFFGAVDVFAPFSPLELDREWRRGVDAARVEVQLSPKASVDVVAVPTGKRETSAVVGRVRADFDRFDAELVGGQRAEDWFAGLCASGPAFDAEWHAEVAGFVLPVAWAPGGTFGNERLVLKAVAGASTQLQVGDGLRVFGEYHYNGFGLPMPVTLLSLATSAGFQDRLSRADFQTLGRHLVAVGASTTVGMTLGVSLQVMVDPLDGSGVVVPSLGWDLAENASLLFGAYAGWGRSPSSAALESQFGATPFSALLQLKVYDQRSVAKR